MVHHQANDLFELSFGVIYQDEQIIKSEGGPLLPDFTRIDMAMTLTPNESDTVRINIENLGDILSSHSIIAFTLVEFHQVFFVGESKESNLHFKCFTKSIFLSKKF